MLPDLDYTLQDASKGAASASKYVTGNPAFVPYSELAASMAEKAHLHSTRPADELAQHTATQAQLKHMTHLQAVLAHHCEQEVQAKAALQSAEQEELGFVSGMQSLKVEIAELEVRWQPVRGIPALVQICAAVQGSTLFV